jgi:D-glycero-alpha-D-manno-heptose-7-phosphate kinase
MIITRTPLRISFAGGGTDFEDYYKTGYGAVMSAAINKYVYITVNPRFDNSFRISYSRTEIVDDQKDIQHDMIREALKMVGITKGMEITSIADIPSGTGLGSSASFAVGLLNALYTYAGKKLTSEKLAQYACQLEIDVLKRPVGKQDQYAAAYGSINYFRFNADESVERRNIWLDDEDIVQMEHRLMLFYTGQSRDAGDILQKQKTDIPSHIGTLDAMRAQADTLSEILEKKGFNEQFGHILHDGWLMKKTLAEKITNSEMDGYYQKALHAGAIGGKLLGAGGGGFLLVYCDDSYREHVRKALRLRLLRFRISRSGSEVVFFA